MPSRRTSFWGHCFVTEVVNEVERPKNGSPRSTNVLDMEIMMQPRNCLHRIILFSCIWWSIHACNAQPAARVAQDTSVEHAPPENSAAPPPARRKHPKKVPPPPLEKRCHRALAEHCQTCPTYEQARNNAVFGDKHVYKSIEMGECRNWRFVYTHTGFSGVTEFFNPEGRLIGAITSEDYPRPCNGVESDLIEHSFGTTPVVDLRALRTCASAEALLIDLVEE